MIATSWPVISATLTDPQPGSGVQPLSTTLIIDSEVVTPQVNTTSGFAYTPTVRLAEGVHTVTAQVYDQAGNQTQSGPWSFTVVDDSAVSLGVTKYDMLGSQRIAMRQDDVVYFIHSDHLGSTSLTTDITGTVVAETRYLPYGEERWITGTLVTDFTFTGQRAEAGFRLMDYNARYYDPGLGRFVSADTVVPEYTNPQDLNRYSYVRGNPLLYADPSGQCIPGVDCPGMVSDVTDPGEAPPGGEAYAGWLVNFIGWVEQGQAETGGMLDWGLAQQAAAFELSTFLMKDPEMLDELLWQEVAQGASMTGAVIASGTAEVMAAGSVGAVIGAVKSRFGLGRKLGENERVVIFESSQGSGTFKTWESGERGGISAQSLDVVGTPEQAYRGAFKNRDPATGEPYWETTGGLIASSRRFAYHDAEGSPGHVGIYGGRWTPAKWFTRIWTRKEFK